MARKDGEHIPRYRAFTIDGHLCRRCDSETIEELNNRIKHYPKECKYQPYFVRDNVEEKWL